MTHETLMAIRNSAVFICAGGLACWLLWRTVRQNWTRIVEALRGEG